MKPILFNTEMVRAILDGRKTVTRRVVKPSPINHLRHIKDGTKYGYWMDGNCQPFKPRYHPGDILYVRETWNSIRLGNGGKVPFHTKYWYKADETEGADTGVLRNRWRPSIHMPKEAARLFLRVMGLKVQRVQDITDEEAQQEGCTDQADLRRIWNDCYAKPHPVKGEDGEIDHYESYPWEEIRETRTYRGKPWYVIGNPWVWVIEFERISKEEAQK